VIPYFKQLAIEKLPIPITDKRMTRFWISIQQAVDFVTDSFDVMHGGELYVPRIPSMKLLDLVNAISPNCKITEIGVRPGEKLHEEMISADDSRRTILAGDRYIVMPVVAEWGYETPTGIPMEEDRAFRSDTNELWISSQEISTYLKSISA
jgi:UDP-N-acetylglucosamine 4,6-dehydratase